jgi:endonuclease/exonuclease/phosphatase family metal-dependent hydrolase
VATYNLLQFNGSVIQQRLDAFKIVLSELDADLIVTQEIANQSAVNTFLGSVLNAAGGPGGYSAASFTDTSSSLDQALFYRSAKLTFDPSGYVVLNTSPRDTPRWQLQPVGEPSGDSDFYVYSMHLHSSDSGSRLAQATIVRANANAFPPGTHFIFAGDFNIDSSGESSYQQFVGSLADNDGRGFDPINSPGTWHNNSSFSLIHTQSPHNNNPGGPGGGVGGGLDDRFDFMLISAALQDGQGLSYLAGTYGTYGNDGLHYNNDINDSPALPNPPYPPTMADALHAASDHLPVVMDLQDPIGMPEIGPIPTVSFGLVLVGSSGQATITVENTTAPPALDLEYNLEVTAGFTAPEDDFIEPAGGGGNDHVLTMAGDSPGNKFGTLTIDNNSFNDPTMTVNLTGGVVVGGDMDLNGVVEPADIPGFVSVLLDLPGTSELDRFVADLNGDESNDGDDIPLFVSALLP